MRTFIFVLIFMFSSTAFAGGTGYEKSKCYGHYKNDQCTFEKVDYPYEFEPKYCTFNDQSLF